MTSESAESADDPGDKRPASIWLAAAPAGPEERGLALAVVLVLLLLFAATAAWAKRPLPQVWAFIPIYESALVLSDLFTAMLLVGQFWIARSRALLVLAGGYLFTACMTVAHGLTFPGLFTPDGLLGAGPQSTAWLYMFWHGGFPLVVIAYALMRNGRFEPMAARARGRALLATALLAAGAAVLCTLLATDGQALLPPIMQGNQYTPAMTAVVTLVWLASPVALAVLLRRRPLAVLDLWLAVVLTAWLLDIALSAVLNAGRFDLGFYAGRVYGLLAASFVLGRLLLENGALHARLMNAHAKERRRSAELQQLTQQLKASNVQLGASNLRLEEQSRFKSEFLANMSHELRTPLNAVIGFSELLRDGLAGEGSERRRLFAAHIHQSGHHLLSLINDILDLSKIEAGKVEITLERVHLEPVLADTLAMVAERAKARNVRVRSDLPGGLGAPRVDRRRLKQILLNLVSNAIKFSPEGGVVQVRVAGVERTRAATALPGFAAGLRRPLPDSGYARFVEISVSDAGIGIAPDDLQKLFKPFTQISNAVTRNAEGTGLGLMLVQRLAELHGGTVAVSSEPGRGSCFTVWLPWRGEDDDPVEAAAASRPAAADRPLALVIEDNDQAAALMSAQLDTQGFAVRRVVSAEEALALAPECTPALITLDILLPGMDGWEFLSRRKDIAGWDAVPVVVVSIVADQRKGFSLGAALVLQKPIARDALALGLQRLGLVPDGEQAVTILVIDDEPGAVELMATQLRQRGYTVLRAFSGREGVELARRFRPDLITLDLEMPELNGFGVVDALKSDPSTAQIPVVVVTAQDLNADDRARLNDHILDIADKSELDQGWFAGEVQRALARRA
ncbi:MAG TPA: response regulator [Methylibium sp.]|nr:response regulator [Methylibium sp.]